MLKSWTVENFKSISKKTILDFAPLTIFAGANSSGKSSVIQSILLVTQSFQSNSWSRCVVLNGSITRLGSFFDIVSSKRPESAINIGFEIKPSQLEFSYLVSHKFMHLPEEYLKTVNAVKCEFSFSAEKADKNNNLGLYPALLHSKVDVTYTSIDQKNKTDELHIRRRVSDMAPLLTECNVSSEAASSFGIFFRYEVEKPKNYRSRSRDEYVQSGKPVGCITKYFLPSYVAYAYDSLEAKCNALIDRLAGSRVSIRAGNDIVLEGFELLAETEAARNAVIELIHEAIDNAGKYSSTNQIAELSKLYSEFTLASLNKVLRLIGVRARQYIARRLANEEYVSELKLLIKGQRAPEGRISYGAPTARVERSIDYVESYFSTSVKYIGPLRDEPKSLYPFSGNGESDDVGFKGELTAAVLETHGKDRVSYIPSSVFKNTNSSIEQKSSTLLDAVIDWVAYMGVAQSVETEDKGKLGHEMKVVPTGGGEPHDLTHVGVGVSQLLPILVQALLMPSGAVLILEQPELHLHPSVQAKFADFLVSQALLNKQILVETHSEYLVNRLRLLSVLADDDSISKLTKIYFVEKEDGESMYKPIVINEFGVIVNWPQGFFDEAEDIAGQIVRAAMAKKMSKNKD